MTTRLNAELLERGFITTHESESSPSLLLYLSNKRSTNRRLLIKKIDTLEPIGMSIPPSLTNNNKTANVVNVDSNKYLSVCLSPRQIISCAGATNYVILQGLDGLYTVEVNGHIIIDKQTFNVLDTNAVTNVFTKEIGFRSIRINDPTEGNPPFYIIMLENDIVVNNARVKIIYESETGRGISYVNPIMAHDLTGIDPNTLPNLATNNTALGSSIGYTFCLESNLVQPVCHNFGAVNYVLDGNVLSNRVVRVFPNLDEYGSNRFNITINDKPATIDYEEGIVDLNGLSHLNKRYSLRTDDRLYYWDVSDYDDLEDPYKPAVIIRGWYTSNTDLKVEDEFKFCYDGFFTNTDAQPFLISPQGNPIVSSTVNTRYVKTVLSSKYYSVSIHGKVTFLPWANKLSFIEITCTNPPVDVLTPESIVWDNPTKTFTVTYPYHDPQVTTAYAKLCFNLDRSDIITSKVNSTTNIVNANFNNISEDYSKDTIIAELTEDLPNDLFKNCYIASSSRNHTLVVSADYDGLDRHDYLPNTVTANVISVIKPGNFPSPFSARLLTTEEYGIATLDKVSISSTFAMDVNNAELALVDFLFPWNPLPNYLDTVSEYVLLKLEEDKVTPATIVKITTRDINSNVIEEITKTTDDLDSLGTSVGVILHLRGVFVNYFIEVDYDGDSELYKFGQLAINVTSRMAARPTFDIICTGAQDDVTFVTEPETMYTVIIDGVNSTLLTRDQMINYLRSQPDLEVKVNDP